MGRSLPWLAAALCALAGVCLWYYRVAASTGPKSAAKIVQEAWGPGRLVALEGEQIIRMPGASGQPVEVQARVLTSRQGLLRIEYLTAPLKGVTIWDDGERTYRYNPDARRLTVSQKRSTAADEAAQELQLLQNYTMRIVGEDVVAGQDALGVELRPKSASDRWKRVWIDRDRSVILVSEDLNRKGQVLRSTRYTQVRYLPPDQEPQPERFRPPENLIRQFATARPGDSSSRFTPAQLVKLVGFPIREPKWLPPGYRLEGAYQTPCGCDPHHQAVRLEYRDGLNAISFFQCGHPTCRSNTNCFAPDGNARMAVPYEQNGVSYLAVGDVPRADLERLIHSAADGK